MKKLRKIIPELLNNTDAASEVKEITNDCMSHNTHNTQTSGQCIFIVFQAFSDNENYS
jgi:hypothetical protein